MASILPPHFVPVTHFVTDPADRVGLASDEEWDEEIEEEIITMSLSRHIDTALLAHPPPAGSKLPQATVPVNQPASGPSGLNTNVGGEAGPSTVAHAALKKAGGQKHTWSLIGLNSPTPYLKVNNTIFKGRAMESVESEMILSMKRPRRKGREENEEDQWAAYQIPLLASEHMLLFTQQQTATEDYPDSRLFEVRGRTGPRGPLQRPTGPKKRLSMPEGLSSAIIAATTGGRGRGRGRGRGGGPGSRGGRGASTGRGRGRGRGRGGKGKAPDRESATNDANEDGVEAEHSASEHSDRWEAADDGNVSSDLEDPSSLRQGSRRSSRKPKPRLSQPDYGNIFEDLPPAVLDSHGLDNKDSQNPQPMEVDPALFEAIASAATATSAGLQQMAGFDDSD